MKQTAGKVQRKHAPPSIRLQEVAEHCGVSPITASRAIRHDPRVREATRLRVLEAAQALGYDPFRNAAARRLAMQRHGYATLQHLIALLVPVNFYEVAYFNSMLKGILDVLTKRGYGLLCCYPPEGAERDNLPLHFLRNEFDGLIVSPSARAMRNVIHFMREQPSFCAKPMVSLTTAYPGTACVGIDDFDGGRQIADHLLDLGHRHIIHYFSAGNEQLQRYEGMAAALTARGLHPRTYLHYTGPFEDYSRAVDESLEEHEGTILRALHAIPQATAIVARHDIHAASIWKRLAAAGRRVPEDISLVGFNDTDPFLDAHGQNLLTSVRTPLCDIGQRAAELVIAMIEGREPTPEHARIPVALVTRRSTAPPPANSRPLV